MSELRRIRKHFVFEGRVQGVGFRWTARYAAEQFNLTGWVANMYDGSVEMEVQGEESSIEQMIEEIKNGRFIRINRVDSREIPIEDNERGFSVKEL